MELDFDDPPALAVPHKCNRRGAVFALRILLANPGAYVEDSENLLRLLGEEARWPAPIQAALGKALARERDDEDGEQPNGTVLHIGPLLRRRQAFRTYNEVISRQFVEAPRLIQEALEDNLAHLAPGKQWKKPGNPNIALLGRLLRLSPLELRLLDFAELRHFEPFRQFLRSISGFAPNEAFELLAQAIAAPAHQVRAALSSQSPLRALGLVRLDVSPRDLEDFVALGETGRMFLTEQFRTEAEMLRHVLQASPAPALEHADFQHMEKEFSWLQAYLAQAAAGKVAGANILFYGPPGTGKSEFARLLAASCGLAAFDVKSSDNDGDSVSGKLRMANFVIAQRFLADRQDSLLVFDEIEDVFPDTGMGLAAFFGRGRNTARPDQSKAWLNHQLEHSPVPAIWISNAIDGIDEAYLRRFAFHLEFRTPPKAARQRVISRCLANLSVSPPLIGQLAADDSLTPAQIHQASRFAKICAGNQETVDEQLLLQAIRASQAAMGRPLLAAATEDGQRPCQFDYLNLDSELPVAQIRQALVRRPLGTLCFYGVPGAGKTSLAHHLAEAMGRPLLVKRASDLLGKYVGESEKRIAGMFREAAQEGAVLLLDEADSFLRDRRLAAHSWEVTQVNELLQQMESFAGVFICTTNLMQEVDPAALRRFTFKIRFDALAPAQRRAMFAAQVMGIPSHTLPADIGRALDRLHALTPGDFATVQRQERMLGERYSPAHFLAQLLREHTAKAGEQRPGMGFLA